MSSSLRPHALAACQYSLSIPNSQTLPKLMSIESVILSNHLILHHPLLLLPSIFPSIRVFSNESVLHIKWPKYWSFSCSISLSSEQSGLISFRIELVWPWCPRDSIFFSSTTVQKHQFFCTQPFLWSNSHIMVQLSHLYMTTGKTIAFTIWIFVGKVMSLLFNMLFRFVTAFLPRSKCLLISWLQSRLEE